MTDDIEKLLADAGKAGHDACVGDEPECYAANARAVLAKLRIQIEGYEWAVWFHDIDEISAPYGDWNPVAARIMAHEVSSRHPLSKVVRRLKAKTGWEDAP